MASVNFVEMSEKSSFSCAIQRILASVLASISACLFPKLPFLCISVSDVPNCVTWESHSSALALGTWPDTCNLHKVAYWRFLILVRVFAKVTQSKLTQETFFQCKFITETTWWLLIKLVLWRWNRRYWVNSVFIDTCAIKILLHVKFELNSFELPNF
jgi:hypothetical protein